MRRKTLGMKGIPLCLYWGGGFVGFLGGLLREPILCAEGVIHGLGTRGRRKSADYRECRKQGGVPWKWGGNEAIMPLYRDCSSLGGPKGGCGEWRKGGLTRLSVRKKGPF